MNQLELKQKDNCLFTQAERELLASLQNVMALAIKKKSKVERAKIMKDIAGEHHELMVRWLSCSIIGQVR